LSQLFLPFTEMGNSESSTPPATSKPRTGPNIYLNVYVPSEQQDKAKVPGFGVYHTGIQIFGKEYFFAQGTSGSGVHEQTPKTSPPGSPWVFSEQLDMGKTDLSDVEVRNVMAKVRDDFPANTYHLMHRNCNHFSELCCHRLHVQFPSWVNRAAKWGSSFQGGQGPPNLVEEDKRREEAMKKQKQQHQIETQELNSRQQNLKPEPPKDAMEVVEIQINCPNGTKTKRRFLQSDRIKDVMNFVEAHDLSIKRNSFYLRCNYPKIVYDKPMKTLKEVGMGKRENLFIQRKL